MLVEHEGRLILIEEPIDLAKRRPTLHPSQVIDLTDDSDDMMPGSSGSLVESIRDFREECEDLFLISSTIHSFSVSFPLYHLSPDLNMSLNCSLCNPLLYAYPHREGYVVLVYRQYTPKGLWTTSRNS